jgi:hypothetical protein
VLYFFSRVVLALVVHDRKSITYDIHPNERSDSQQGETYADVTNDT